jgi:hypothetical protein
LGAVQVDPIEEVTEASDFGLSRVDDLNLLGDWIGGRARLCAREEQCQNAGQ